MSDITFSCPACAQHIACDESGRGERINCPTCDSAVTIPTSGTPPPLPLLPATVAQIGSGDQRIDIELESRKKSKDWLLTVESNFGERHTYDMDRFVTALRIGVLNGQYGSATKVEVHSKTEDGKWNTSASTLGQFAKGNFQLRVLYEPVWSHAMAGLKWGALAGIGLKLIDTFFLFASVNPTVAFMFLVVAGVCFIPRIGFAALVGVSLLMSKFTGMNLFMPVLSATLVGAVLGCLPGMAIGGIIGVSRKRALARAKDAEPEPAGLALKTVALPFVGAGAIWGLYLFVFNPWLASVLEK